MYKVTYSPHRRFMERLWGKHTKNIDERQPNNIIVHTHTNTRRHKIFNTKFCVIFLLLNFSSSLIFSFASLLSTSSALVCPIHSIIFICNAILISRVGYNASGFRNMFTMASENIYAFNSLIHCVHVCVSIGKSEWSVETDGAKN